MGHLQVGSRLVWKQKKTTLENSIDSVIYLLIYFWISNPDIRYWVLKPSKLASVNYDGKLDSSKYLQTQFKSLEA